MLHGHPAHADLIRLVVAVAMIVVSRRYLDCVRRLEAVRSIPAIVQYALFCLAGAIITLLAYPQFHRATEHDAPASRVLTTMASFLPLRGHIRVA